MTSYLRMETVHEEALCVLWFSETKSVTKKQRRYRIQYGRDPPLDTKAMRRWVKQLQETGSVLRRKGARRPSTAQEDVDRVQEAWTSYVPRL
jgi:transposase